MFDEALGTDALLLGRRTDAWFAERWLSRTGEWADRLNGLPKYVVSSTARPRPVGAPERFLPATSWPRSRS